MSERSETILIVDDVELNLLVAERAIKMSGFRTLRASSGKEALEVFGRERPDLVLMDLRMPGMDGYETAAKIIEMERGKDRSVPIVALTAYAEPEHRQRCKEAGFDAFLTKPIDIDEAISIIAGLLDPVRTEHETS